MEKAPFQVGGHVYPPYFVGRDKELEEIVRGISTLSQNYLIIGPRRSGKSSLLANVESELVKRDLLVIAVNCIEATTCSEFFRIVVERALEAYEKKERVKGLLEIFKRSLRESITGIIERVERVGGSVEGIVKTYLSFREREMDEHELAKRTFDFLDDFRVEKGLEIVLILDEFQDLANFDGYLFRLMKSRADRTKIRYIFSGSSISIIQQVFLKPQSPLYLMATKLYLPPLETKKIKDYISARLGLFGIEVDDPALEEICRLVSGIPFYFQKMGDLCYRTAVLSGKRQIDREDVKSAFADMLREFSTEFEYRFETRFSPRQQAILKAMAIGRRRVSAIAKELGLAVNVLGKDMRLLCDSLAIERLRRGEYEIVDWVFKSWLGDMIS